jgi:hypothetical protein
MHDHRNLQTIYVGHEQVRYHESGGSLSELAESFLTIGRLSDHISSSFQHLPKKGTDLLVVVNNENRTMILCDVLLDVAAASGAMEVPARSKGLDC